MKKPPVVVSPSDSAMQVWAAGLSLTDGDEIEIPFPSRDDAARVQRWFFRERKRHKKQMLAGQLAGATRGERIDSAGMDPDAADPMRGVVSFLRERSLVLQKLKPLAKAILTRANGKKEKIDLRKLCAH